jgi:Uma2 family endonuclease
MSASLKPLTVDEFLAWERAQPLRYEFDGIQPIERTGGSTQYSRIQTRVVIALGTRLTPPREVLGSGLKIVTATRVRYPDASVRCGNADDASDVIEPTAAFEVLSPSTMLTDRRVKPHDYASVPTIQVYCVFDAEQPRATVMRRSGGWEQEIHEGLERTISLPEFGIDLPLTAIYRR